MYCIGLASHIEPMFLHESNGDDLSITAIIPAYNEAEHIERTIKSILKQSKKITKILVIDDASTDRTLEVVKKFSFIHVLENRERIGKAASLNRALPLVNTDLVLIVDADTELEESFVWKACNVLYEKETIALCGTVLPSENSTNRYIQHGRLVEYIYSQTTLKKGQEMINGLFVLAGCCLVIDARIIKEIGIPEDTVTEDLDLTWLLELNGHKVSTIDEHAFTIEPKSLFSYVSQIKRWYMGFFQCLSKYGTKIFNNTSLSFTVLLLLLEIADRV